jgi:uncharacterized protein YciI
VSEEGRAPGPAQWQVLLHTPGPRWDPDRHAGEQPGIEQHYAFVAGLLERGLLVAAGPLRDVDGHGMTVARFPSLDAAEHAATRQDPSVAGGLLAVRVRPWSVVMTVVPGAPAAEEGPGR